MRRTTFLSFVCRMDWCLLSESSSSFDTASGAFSCGVISDASSCRVNIQNSCRGRGSRGNCPPPSNFCPPENCRKNFFVRKLSSKMTNLGWIENTHSGEFFRAKSKFWASNNFSSIENKQRRSEYWSHILTCDARGHRGHIFGKNSSVDGHTAVGNRTFKIFILPRASWY